MASTQRVFAFLRLSSPSGLGRVIVCVQLETNRICSWLDTEVRKICKISKVRDPSDPNSRTTFALTPRWRLGALLQNKSLIHSSSTMTRA